MNSKLLKQECISIRKSTYIGDSWHGMTNPAADIFTKEDKDVASTLQLQRIQKPSRWASLVRLHSTYKNTI